MFQSPYATSNGSMHNLTKIVKAIELSKTSGLLSQCESPEVEKLYYIDVSPETKNIPAVPMPLTVSDQHRKDDWYVVMDLRPYSSYLSRLKDGTGKVSIPDQGPVGLLFKQALLQMIWHKGEGSRLLTASDLPLAVYSTWIAETLQHKFGLNPHVQSQVKVLCGWFYICLFTDDADVGEIESQMSSKIMKLSRTMQMDVSIVHDTVRAAGYLADISALVEAIANLGDPKAQQLNVGLLMTLLSRGWFGHTNDSYSVAAALEFPPLFLGYVYSAATETSYKETPIAKTTSRFNRNSGLENFKRIMDGFFQSALTGSN